jgi:hypothetical protein
MTEIQRRITVTSSLNEIFTNRAVERGEALLRPLLHFFYSKHLDRYLNDYVNGFSPTSKIFFMTIGLLSVDEFAAILAQQLVNEFAFFFPQVSGPAGIPELQCRAPFHR